MESTFGNKLSNAFTLQQSVYIHVPKDQPFLSRGGSPTSVAKTQNIQSPGEKIESGQVIRMQLQRGRPQSTAGLPTNVVKTQLKTTPMTSIPSGSLPPPPPPPTRRVELVPYNQRYLDYQQQLIHVPVQRAYTDYYCVEHITDFLPITKEDIVYETHPKEVVSFKVNYVPVETKIVHLPSQQPVATRVGGHKANGLAEFQLRKNKPLPANQQFYTRTEYPKQIDSNNVNRVRYFAKSHYVTSEFNNLNYSQEVDRLLQESEQTLLKIDRGKAEVRKTVETGPIKVK